MVQVLLAIILLFGLWVALEPTFGHIKVGDKKKLIMWYNSNNGREYIILF